MNFERLLNKSEKPTDIQIENHLRNSLLLWRDIHNYITTNFDYIPELNFFTKKYGWSVRYRRSGKTLCYLFPEENAFSALIVLGKNESEIVISRIEYLNSKVKEIFYSTEQLHDGRWLWIRIFDTSDLDSFIILLNAKKTSSSKKI